MAKLHGESAEVPLEVTKQLKSQLPNTCEGYPLEDIYNCDKTCIFLRAIPFRKFVWQGEALMGIKVLKERVNILLTYSGNGRRKNLWLMGNCQAATLFPQVCIWLTKTPYLQTQKTLMKSAIFTEHLTWLNDTILMQWKKYSAVVSSYPSHASVSLMTWT